MRTLAVLCSLLAVITTILGADPKNGSSIYSLDEGSNRIEFSWTWKKVDDGSVEPRSGWCMNVCRGQKHFVHSQCDASCDIACATLHEETLVPLTKEFPPEFEADTRTNLARFGVSNSKERAVACVYWAREDAFKGFDLSKQTAKIKSACWNSKHCTSSIRRYRLIRWECTVTILPYRDTNLDDGTTLKTKGPISTGRFVVSVPTSEIAQTDESENCRCKIVTDVPEDREVGYLPGGGIVPKEETAVCTVGGTSKPLVGDQFAQCEFEVVTSGMNSAEISCISAPPGFESITIPCGWELQCLSGGGQDTVLIDDVTLPCGQKSTFEKVRVRTLCLDITKPEPSARMRYRLVPPSSQLFARLAQISRASRFRGPWDQARFWIVTNHSSYQDIYDKIRPAPAQREYVREYYSAWRAGAISLDDPDYWNLLRREVLLESALDAGSARWVLSEHLRRDQKGTIAFLRANASAMDHILSQRDGDAHIAAVVDVLVQNGESETAFWLVGEAANESFQVALAEGEVGSSLASHLKVTADNGLADAILKWLELDKTGHAAFFALNPNASLSDAVKKRAMAYASREAP